ncbi:beta/gamma crystallin-related protein [Nitrospirillum pindoramense]|uniref:Beta/gamma crystallin n=1 Tax=Nitrospirillum amazonense TaxID=28077 RepID=A0A560GME9_9PROT|nr:beta/gamma crystallin-related protein [Nitrospirillum amazonense]TWB35163.1 beta/gamma crystallin [Nitrospirillum amazonense]
MTRLMHRVMGAAVLAGTLMTAGGALAGEITLYSEAFFRGDALTIRDGVENLADMGRWNDRAKSMIVRSGEWEVCKDSGFRNCKRVGRGTRIGDLGEIGLYNAISSARQIDGRYYQPEPPPPPVYDPPPPPPPVYGPPPGYGGGITWNNAPSGPPAYDQPPPPPPSYGGGVTWNDDRRDGPPPMGDCRRRIYDAFVQRFGPPGDVNFRGEEWEGRIFWNGDRWHYRCTPEQINIWQ